MKKYLKLLLSLLMILTLTYSVNAEEVEIAKTEDSKIKNETIFTLDKNLTYDYVNDGISFILAENLTLKGTSEYAFILGKHVDGSEGGIEKDAFILGSNINFSGTIGRDAYVAGEKVVLGGTIGRNLMAACEDLTLEGTINGDLHLTVKNLTIKDGSVITGKITLNEDAVIEGKTDGLLLETYAANVHEEDEETLLDKVFDFISSIINMILVGLVMVYLFGTKTFDKNFKEYGVKKYATTAGVGFVTIIVVPVVAILLMISTFGLGLGLLTIVFYAACFYLSQVITSYFVGKYTIKLAKIKENKYITVALGALVYKVLYVLPIVNGIAALLAITYGFGYLCNIVFKKN